MGVTNPNETNIGDLPIPTSTYHLTFPSPMNQRGFWLYFWKIQYQDRELLYVGRTGDNSSANAASPINRIGQHLDTNEKSNPLRTHLQKLDIQPEDCTDFELIAFGPIFEEDKAWSKHLPLRDIMAALEMKLAESLAVDHTVMNEVKSKMKLDTMLWEQVRKAFANHFSDLRTTADNQPHG